MQFRLAVGCALMAGLAGSAVPSEAAPPSPCGRDVYVNTAIAGSQSDPGGFAFVSDGNSSYPTGGKGQNRIESRLQYDGCWFDYLFNINNSRNAYALLSDGVHVSRFFNFDRVASIPVTPGPENTTFGDSAFCADGVVTNPDGSYRRNADGSYQDNYAGCGLDERGWYVRRGGSINLYEGPDRDFRLRFRPSPLQLPSGDYCAANPAECEVLSWLRVYHPTANTWTVIPEGGSTAALFLLSGGNPWQLVSYESVPFRIDAVRP